MVVSGVVVFFVACLKISGVKKVSLGDEPWQDFARKASESLQVWPCIDLCIFCLPELPCLVLRCYSGINNTILNILLPCNSVVS